MAFCSQCGAQSGDGEKFCASCGAPLNGPSVPSTPTSDPSGGMPKAPQVDSIQAAPAAPTTIPGLAPYGKRIGGYLIDGTILLVAGVVLEIGAGSNGGNVIGIALGFLYAFILIAVWQGHTVGMKALKLQAVKADDQGSVDWGASAIRSVIHIVLWITFIGGILDLLWPLWDAKNQTLHDKAAGTIVIDEPVSPGAVS